ncbi:hypothetical protein QUV83_03285 [Cellulomonas cellasea]|uniref:hypothetical protein n=1 Tax=Cellulomonas cellasea TaxID=43670 RepID=UPI0025A36F24|nr:hypothetical protein [Cellulomonas cellasea]MDM8083788.1 hypothetical protein [Cellulomonas cellasea]
MTAANTLMEPTELRDTLKQYVPAGVEARVWSPLQGPAIDLVLAAGPPRWERAGKDLQLIADLASYLSRTGAQITLDAALADTALTGLDGQQAVAGRAPGTRTNKRARFHRLQAAYRGVPWRKPRRDDGQRIESLPQPGDVAQIVSLLPADRAGGRLGAGAVQSALDAARRARVKAPDAETVADGSQTPHADHELDPKVWAAARSYARANNVALTKRLLDARAVFEVFERPEPVAVLASRFHLTRRDLELGLTQLAMLPVEPAPEHAALLRG